MPQRRNGFRRFLAGVEGRAFRIARYGLRNDEDALDAVQDAMTRLARRYAARPSAEWARSLRSSRTCEVM